MPDLTQFRTNVDIFSNVPLEYGNGHSLLFVNRAAQRAYFDSKKTLSNTFTNISYQRHKSGTMRLQASMSLLGNANYLRFVNTTFENIEFYAFILDITYVNNSTVEITYAIDIIQTWMFDYSINPCFVDREHADIDNVGDNRVNEGLDTGPFIQAGIEEISDWGTTTNDTSFFVVATESPSGSPGVNFDYNVYSAFHCVNCATIADLNTLLSNYMSGATLSLAPIISITQYPSYFYDSVTGKVKSNTYTLTNDQTIGLGGFMATDPLGYTIPINTLTYRDPDFTHPSLRTTEVTYGKMFENGVVRMNDSDSWIAPAGTPYYSDANFQTQIGTLATEQNVNEFAPNVGSFIIAGTITTAYVSLALCTREYLYVDISDCTVGGMTNYIPKNNKLYCYPYNYMVFESPDGSSNTLRYEDFKNHNIHQFYSTFTPFPFGESMCAPINYETVTNTYNLQNALFCKAYPTCGLATDAYQAWWAQNKFGMSLVKAGVDAVDAISGAAKEGYGAAKEAYNDNSGWVDTGNSALNSFLKTMISPAIGLATASNKLLGGLSQTAQNVMENTNAATVAGAALEAFSIANAPETIAKSLIAMGAHAAMPDSVVTKANAESLLTYMGMLNYRIYYMKIRPEYAEMIDNYFSCYGYAVKRVKRPNIRSRTEWNYIKTTGCTISGAVPGDVEHLICSAYDSGLTFWHNPDHMYRYDLDNPIRRE